MKAIILSAGRGSRLLPLTQDLPKCLLDVGGRSVLALQLDTLHAAGIEEAVVVTGFNAHMVEAKIAARALAAPGPRVTTLFNPFYQVADNLASCWMARAHMDDDFIVINGDTLFSAPVIDAILTAQDTPISVTIDQKADYDSDDMKVTLDGTALAAIGKTLAPERSHAESIGMLRFMGKGTRIFREMLEAKMRTPEGTKSWYLKAIDGLAKSGVPVGTINILGAAWSELDTPEDLAICRELFGNPRKDRDTVCRAVV